MGQFVKLWVGRLAEDIATGKLQTKRPILAKYLFVNEKAAASDLETKNEEQMNNNNDDNNNTQQQQSQTFVEETTSVQLEKERYQVKEIDSIQSQSIIEEEEIPISTTTKPKSNTSSLKKNDTTTCIIDLGVYTRNRLFRLMGAAKYGKSPSAALRIADSNAFEFPAGFSNDNFYKQQHDVDGGDEALTQDDDDYNRHDYKGGCFSPGGAVST